MATLSRGDLALATKNSSRLAGVFGPEMPAPGGTPPGGTPLGGTPLGGTHGHKAVGAASSSVNWCGDFRDSRALRQRLGAPPAGFATCALVGSSGVLSLERLGERIDAAEFVMRFNLNQVGGFEPIVGSITTLRLLDTEAIADMIAERREEIRQGGARLRRFRNASWCPAYSVYLNTPNKLHRDTFAAMCSRATKIIDSSVRSARPNPKPNPRAPRAGPSPHAPVRARTPEPGPGLRRAQGRARRAGPAREQPDVRPSL